MAQNMSVRCVRCASPARSSILTLRFDSVQLIVTCIAQGKRHGHGRYTYAKGGYYEGEWQNGKHNGQGKHVDAKGRVYEGSWKDGQKHGEYKPVHGNLYFLSACEVRIFPD